jgi:hypothetical protein
MKIERHQLFWLVTTLCLTPLLPSPAQEMSPIGTWGTVGNIADYVSPNGTITGTSTTAHHITLKADGSYQKTDYYNFRDCWWFQHSGTYKIQADRILFKPKKHHQAQCGQSAQKRPLKTLTVRWRFKEYNDGIKLELLDSIGTQDWEYAHRLSRQE